MLWFTDVLLLVTVVTNCVVIKKLMERDVAGLCVMVILSTIIFIIAFSNGLSVMVEELRSPEHKFSTCVQKMPAKHRDFCEKYLNEKQVNDK